MSPLSETRSAPRQAGMPLAARILAGWLERISTGRLTLCPPRGPARTYTGSRSGPEAELRLRRPARVLARVLHRGDLGFAEAYMAGEWDTPDLAALIELLIYNEHAYNASPAGRWYSRLALALYHRLRPNTPTGSRRNIAAHYDLGNDFYELWLDETMTYSSALFAGPEQGLAAAQRHKHAETLRQLGARPGEHLLEIGCGWGSLARAAAEAGVHVTGVTLSREQLAWAREHLRGAGGAERAELCLADYRELAGTYDHIASIEMFEAVGREHWPAFFATLQQRLRPGGRALLQVITIDEAAFPVYEQAPDFIQRYIFPGGMLPTLGHLRDGLQDAGLAIEQVSAHGGDYAATLAAWQRRFNARAEALEALGFGERFQRMWRYYLGYCEGGFRSGRIELHRILARRPDA